MLRQAFERAELEWPDPPVMCTVALARRLAPLQRRRGLASLADALGIEVEATHRALPDAETCARVLCALLPRLCANARTVGEALALLRPAPARRGRRPPKITRGRDDRPDLSALPKDPGVYIFRDADGRPLYVGKSICLRTRARAHFTTPSTWTGQAEHVDYQPTESELGALVLENRLIKALKPPGNTQLKKEADGYVYLRCRLDIPFPILEVAREPAAGHAVCVGPVRGRAAAAELVEQLNSLFGLRHCGRALATRPHPSAYGQMGRCLSPCLGDLDPNLYRERLDQALGLFEVDGGAALLAHVEAQMRAAAAAQRYERAAWLRRRARRLESLLGRLGGVLRAAHAGLAARARAAPGGARPRRRVLDRRRPDRRLGPAAGRPRRSSRRARGPRWRGARAAAGCRPTSSTRRGSSARGSPATRTRRCSSSSRAAGRARAGRAGRAPRRATRRQRSRPLPKSGRGRRAACAATRDHGTAPWRSRSSATRSSRSASTPSGAAPAAARSWASTASARSTSCWARQQPLDVIADGGVADVEPLGREPDELGGERRPHELSDRRPPHASTDSGPSGSRSCVGAGLVAGAGRRSSATTCVTGTPVKRATRCGKSYWSHFELRPGSVQTIASSWRAGSKHSATASIGSASPIAPSASRPAARMPSSASSSRSRTASRPPSPGPDAGITSVMRIGERSARAFSASSR